MEILTIGQKIRNRRKQLDMTLKELAGDRVTAGQLSFVELGKSNPSGELLQYIARSLGVSVDYLLESEVSQAQKICEYNIKLSEAYLYDNKVETARTLLGRTADIANKYNLGDIIGKIELYRGRISLNCQSYQGAAEHFLEANKLFLENNDYSGAVDTYILLGQTSCDSGFYNMGLSYFMQAESLVEEKGICDEQQIARIRFSICMCSIKVKNTEYANKYLPSVEKYLESINSKKQYANNLMEMSLAYKDSGEYEKALYYANKALDVFKAIEDKEYISKMLLSIGVIYSEKKDFDKSDYYLKNCEKLEDNLNDSDKPYIYIKLANNCMQQRNYNQAIYYIEKSFKIAIEQKNVECQIDCYKCLYKVYSMYNNYKECESVLKNLLDLLETYERYGELAWCYIELGQYYNLTGDKEAAIKYTNKGFERLEHLKEESIR